MIIGIDGNEANVDNRVGVNQYAFEVLHGLYRIKKAGKSDSEFVIYLKNRPKDDLPKATEWWKYKVLPGKGLWIIKTLVPYLFKHREVNVFFTPSHYAPPIAPVPVVCSIMDLGYLDFTGQFKKYDYWQLRLWSAWSIKVSKYILSISNSTTKHIEKIYPHASKKIKTTLLAYDKTQFNTKISKSSILRANRKYKTGKNYVLFLSTLKPSKNVEGLVQAWEKIESKYPNYKLVIAGKKGWLYEEIFEKVKQLKIEKRVEFSGFVDEKDKPALIAGAKIFVLPSFWEGFGLDVLNAYACGVPVVVSDRGSLPEVAGEVGEYVNHENHEEIAKYMDKLLSLSKKDYNELSKSAIKWAQRFDWDKTARATLKVLENV